MLDLKIVGGSIVDGSGKPAYKGDVGIIGNKIVSIGDLSDVESIKSIDASGKYVTPGFIDIHSHSDYSLYVNSDASARLHDGVTTDVIGNCGIGVAPVSDAHRDDLIQYLGSRLVASIPVKIELPWKTMDNYLTALETNTIAINVVPLAAQGAIRIHEMGFANGRATAEQMRHMKEVLREAMDAGCVGMSSGLIYMPGEYSSQEELSELCEVLNEYGSFYVTHMRNEGNTIFEAIDEAVAIAQHAGIRLHISHLKLTENNRGKVKKLLAFLDDKKKEVKDLVFDVYPFSKGCTSLSATLPPYMFEGGMDALLERLKNPELRRCCRKDMQEGLPGWQCLYRVAGNWSKIIIATCSNKESEYAIGHTIQELADKAGKDAFDWAFDFMIQEKGRVQMIMSGMDEEDVDTITCLTDSMVGSDSMSLSETGVLGTGSPHPRAFCTHSLILRKYVNEEKRLTFEQAIRKFTKLAADHLRLDRRGEILEGYYADLVVVDLPNVKDNSHFGDSKHYSTGFDAVIVNGKIALENGVETRVCSGNVLRHGKGK